MACTFENGGDGCGAALRSPGNSFANHSKPATKTHLPTSTVVCENDG